MLAIALRIAVWGLFVVACLLVEYQLLAAYGWLSSEAKYWNGLGGGIAMLLSLTYPIKKYAFFNHGKLSHWLQIHLVSGLVGVALISLHANFRLRALVPTAAYALMLLIVASGVVLHFLLAKVNQTHYRLEMLGRTQELAPSDADELELLRVLAPRLTYCRTVHYTATYAMAGLAIAHVLSVHYTRGAF